MAGNNKSRALNLLDAAAELRRAEKSTGTSAVSGTKARSTAATQRTASLPEIVQEHMKATGAKAGEEKKKRKEKIRQQSAAAYKEATRSKVPQSAFSRAESEYAKKQAGEARKTYEEYLKSDAYMVDKVKEGVSAASNEAEYYAALQGGGNGSAKEKELKSQVEYWERQAAQKADESTMNKDMEELESWPDADKAALEKYIIERDRQTYKLVGEPSFENAQYNASALFNKYGAQKVNEMAESYSRYQNARNTEQTARKASEKAGESVGGAISQSAASVGTSIVGAVTAPLGYLGEMTGRTGRYSTMDPNNVGNIPNVYSGAVRQQVAGDIEGNEGSKARKALSYGYQGIMSAADSLARLAATGGTGWASLGLAASGSFGQTMSEASKQGASPTQAVIMATADAGLEVLTEKLPMDELLKTAKGGAKSAGQVIGEALKQAGIEATTEEISLLGSLAAEAAILREKSSYNQQIGDLVANGMSYKDAKAQADRAVWEEAKQTAIVSAISGGASSGGAAVASNADYFAGLLRGLVPVKQAEAPKTEKQKFWDAVFRKTFGGETENKTGTDIHMKGQASEELNNTAQIDEIQNQQEVADAGETNAVSKPLESYPTEKQNSIRSYLQAVDEGIKSFVQRVKGGDKSFRRQKVSDVSERAAEDIGRILGIDVHGYTHNINTNGVQHILNRHGENGTHDHSMTLDEDIARVGWVLDNYDSVEPLTENGKQVYSAEFSDSNNNRAPQIRFVKKIDGSYYVVEAACENKYKKLWVQSAYLQKDGDVTQALAEGQRANHETNARSALASPSPVYSIPEESGNVNAENADRYAPQESPEGFEAMGAASKGYSGKEAYYDLLTDENSQPDRPGDVRPMEVPKTDAYGWRVSEFTANAYGAEVTPDAMASRIEELVEDGALGFDTRTNRQSLDAAAAEIQKRGMATTRNQITKSIADGKIRDGDIEKAMLLYATYANQKSQSAQDNAAELMVDLSTMANMTGRNLQLFKMLRRMTPDGQLMAVQKNVERYVDQLNTRRGKKNQAEVSIPQEMMDEYKSAARVGDKTAMDEAEQAIYKVAASQIKATPMEKLNAWRYMAMLGNVKTQVRNVLGNTAFRPYVATKRAIGAVMEQMFVEQESRTKSILGFGKDARALKQWAAQDAKSADTEKLFSYSARSGDAAKGQIEENRAIFDSKALEATRKFIQAVPEGADMIFKRAEYTTSLASFLKARGYTAADLEAGNVTENVLNEAREYAAQEALKATFNDQNAVSDFLSKRYKGNNTFGKAMNLMAEGVLPFRKTPANILVRAAEYSPANIGRSMYNFATKVRSGEMTASTAIDQMAAGLTGTGAMVLGYAMASGLFGFKLQGHLDDEDEKNAGHQAYALEIGGNSYTVDWAAPANIPLFVGANIYDAMKDQEPDAGWFVTAANASVNSLEPMLELSCLSSLNDLLESVRYAEDGTEAYTIVAQGATSYLNQFIPTLFGQIEQATEGEKNQVYSDADTALERSMEKTIGWATQKIPGIDLYQTQKFDNWGRPVETSGPFGALVSPSYASEISTDPVDAEILRLNQAQDENVSIDKPAQTITYTDTDGTLHKNERLTAQQWETVQQVYGQTAKQILDVVIDSKDYKALSDSQKAEVFNLVYDYAREKSRAAAVQDYAGAGDSWMDGIDGKEAGAIINKVAAAAITDAFSALTESWRGGNDGADAVQDLEGAYEVYKGLSLDAQRKVMDSASGRMEYYLTARSKGVSTETFVDLYKVYWDIDQSGSDTSAKAQKWSYELQRAVETRKITRQQQKALKDSMVYMQMFPAEAEKFDQMTESGISANKALDIGKLLKGLTPKAGKSSVTAAQQAEAIAGAKLTDSEMTTVMKLYLNDTQDQNIDDMAAMGYSAADYAAAYSIYTTEKETGGKGTKARTIDRFMEQFGVDRGTATAIYEIYG